MIQPRHLHIAGSSAPQDEVLEKVHSFTSARSGDRDPFRNAPDFKLSASQCAQKHRTDLANGLTKEAAAMVLARDGPNELESPPKPTFLQLFLLQLTSFIIVMLIIAAAASVVVTATGPLKHDLLNYSTGIAIGVLVFVNALIAAYTEHQAGGALDALAKMSQPSIDVIRDGKVDSVNTKEIVRGDVVTLKVGDIIPADLRMSEANDFKVNEAGLTGEPHDIGKNANVYDEKMNLALPSCIVYSGCTVMNGKGKGIVIDTGMDTSIGKIAKLMGDGDASVGNDGAVQKSKKGFTLCPCLPDTSGSQTPLQKNVERLGAMIGVGAIILCVVLFFVGLILQVEDANNPGGATSLYMILISVTLAVAAIPEGIPLTLTIALSFGCTQMVANNVLVRRIAAVETLGSASVICSDKTGTLTEGKMRMTQMFSAGKQYVIGGEGFDPTIGSFEEASTKRVANEDLCVRSTILSSLLCSSTKLVQVPDEEGTLRWEPQGNASEAPIVVSARKLGFHEDAVAVDYPRVFEVPFNSSTKMMLTISELGGRCELCAGGMPLPLGSAYFAVFKGAPNYILDLCTEIMGPDGQAVPMTEALKAQMLDVVDNYSEQALRVLAIAARPLPTLPFDPKDESMPTDAKFKMCANDLRLLGFVASIDPDRVGVKEAVETSRDAGIRVIMITGDYVKTAIAIAKNVKILTREDDEETDALDCVGLRPAGEGKYLPDREIDALTAHVRVFARAKPEDKLEIVKSLQRQGKVTAMTGDGVNDAPALNKADIGVAMGIQGTEVAKGAADMVLRDDNFASIVKAVEKGRIIYAGIQKFVAFIMSVHIAEVVQICFCVLSGMPLMRTPIQILFLILVTDLPPSIALGLEGGERSILLQKPRPKDEPVVLGWMWVSICGNGILLSAVIIGVYVTALYHYCDGLIFQDDILPDCMEDDIECESELETMRLLMNNARTVAFIALVWSENFRAYASRSFDRPVWVNLCGNKYMQLALVSAQVALYVAVLVPGFSDKILELRGTSIGLWGWLFAFVGPLGTVILCEVFKLVTARQMHAYESTKAESFRVAPPNNSIEALERTMISDLPQRSLSEQLNAPDSRV